MKLFDENRASEVLNWLGDARKFDVTEIGFGWLMRLVARSEPLYHDFAVDFLIRAFAPSDFVVNAASEEAVASGPADLQQATFLFTGKLATMTRDEAENKVTAAQGKVAGSVTAKLHYLVMGDEGPLFRMFADSWPKRFSLMICRKIVRFASIRVVSNRRRFINFVNRRMRKPGRSEWN